MSFDRVAILGTGLIGTSVGLAIKAARPATRVTGYDASRDNVTRAQRMKGVDRAAHLLDAVEGAQLVVVATPVGAMETLFEDVGPALAEGTVVMDTGSTKARVMEWAQRSLPASVQFIGGHPMAGKTTTGPDDADANLFRGAVWCVVPPPATGRQAIDDVVSLVESFGAVPYFLDGEEHDGLVAAVSHLPYLMAVALIGHLGKEGSWRETASLAAGGFAYATHLADSDPRMFADVALTNRENITRRLERYIAELETLRAAVAAGDPGLKDWFERARELHNDWLAGRAQGGSQAADNPLPNSRQLLTGTLFGRLGGGGPPTGGR
ncbi:MAG: prephenate dehydrogenase [Chloroflexi bacterium]|nr:prephenate dehydrogenase [Chloroflexota bacterium]